MAVSSGLLHPTMRCTIDEARLLRFHGQCSIDGGEAESGIICCTLRGSALEYWKLSPHHRQSQNPIRS